MGIKDHREHLHFVKNEYGIANIMEFAGICRSGWKKRFKELHIRCDDYR